MEGLTINTKTTYILEDGDELTLHDLKTLNEMGYVYHSEQTKHFASQLRTVNC